MAPPRLAICQSTSCSSGGSAALVRDIEELAGDQCTVEETFCLGHCGKGPNVEFEKGGSKKVIEHVDNYKALCHLIEDEAKLNIEKTAKNIGKISYEARRTEDADKRLKVLEKAFKALGNPAAAEKSEPAVLSHLLALRSQFTLKTDKEQALKDAEKAVQLKPKWAFGNVVLGTAYEALQKYEEANEVLKVALDVGTCIKEAAVTRQMRRINTFLPKDLPPPAAPAAPAGTDEASSTKEHRRVSQPSVSPEVTSGTDWNRQTSAASATTMDSVREEGAKKPARAKSRGKAKARPKRKAATQSSLASMSSMDPIESVPTDGAPAEKKEKPKRAEKSAEKVEAAPPAHQESEKEWRIDSVERLNHDSLGIVLHAMSSSSIRDEPGDLWHLDVIKDGALFEDELKRSYTPLSTIEEYKQGIIRLMIKVYVTGKMTSYLARLRPGSSLIVSPPLATVQLEALEGLVMVAGGSSVTVALQACKSVLARYPMGVPVHLVLCNRTVEDVLYQDAFESLVQEHASFSLQHCISGGCLPPANDNCRIAWKEGRISREDIEEKTAPTMRAVVSGPPGLCEAVVGIWQSIGRDPERLSVLDELPPPKEEESKPMSMIVSL